MAIRRSACCWPAQEPRPACMVASSRATGVVDGLQLRRFTWKERPPTGIRCQRAHFPDRPPHLRFRAITCGSVRRPA